MADGRLGKCKECCKSQATANRNKRVDYYQQYDRDRANLPHRIEAREFYQKTPAGLAAAGEAKKRWAIKNKDRRLAHQMLNNALRAGTVKKGPCEMTGKHSKRVEGHHDDYSKPLEVRWLCSLHHRGLHKTQ